MQFFSDSELTLLKKEISQKVKIAFSHDDFAKALGTQFKEDASSVTDIDLFISRRIKELKNINTSMKAVNYFSEEDQESFDFPALVVDPIDGTRELVRGLPECAVSVALMTEDPAEDHGWIFNPFTGFELSSSSPWVASPSKANGELLGLVSRTEWEKGYYKNQNQQGLIVAPRGSIAFKLALLASGSCDFIASLEPKNIWDIAAGTIICQQRGIHFFEGDTLVTSLNRKRFLPPLYWCRPGDYESIKKRIYKR